MISRLDLDIAIYRDRVQVTHHGNEIFADQRAEYPFSSDVKLIENARFFEDTLVRAIKQVLAEGAFSLRDPIAHVVRFDGELDQQQRGLVEDALRETGMRGVIFELED